MLYYTVFKSKNKSIIMKKIILLSTLFSLSFLVSTIQAYGYFLVGNVNIDLNRDTVVTSDFITGTIYYQSDSRTLTMHNATITMPLSTPISGGIVISQEDSISIVLIGENKITGLVPIEISHSVFHIKGGGNLLLESLYEDSWGGIFFWGLGDWMNRNNGVVISENSHVEINTPYSCGIWTYMNSHFQNDHGCYAEISVNGSSLVINAPRALRNIGQLSLDNCHITVPEQASFNADSATVVDNNGQACGHLEIHRGSPVPEHADPEYTIFCTGQGVNISGVNENVVCEVYNLSGQLIARKVLSDSKEFIQLQRGCYVVKIGDFVKKIVNY